MFRTSIAVFCLVAISALSGAVSAQTKPATPGTENISTPVTELAYFDTGINGVTDAGSILGAAAFGDMTKGEHSTWIRMPAGFEGAVHTHTHDFWVAVVAGVAVNTGIGGQDITLSAGSFWFQPGGKPHYTNCISSVECVYFVNQNGAFDYNVVNK